MYLRLANPNLRLIESFVSAAGWISLYQSIGNLVDLLQNCLSLVWGKTG
jgi:hypothetical protein